jgi:DNA-binding transcriptional regulator YhcF (GntR family)
MATVIESIRRFRKLEEFLVIGGSVLHASQELRVSPKTVQRMMKQMREQGSEFSEVSKGHWVCTKKVFNDPDKDDDLSTI